MKKIFILAALFCALQTFADNYILKYIPNDKGILINLIKINNASYHDFIKDSLKLISNYDFSGTNNNGWTIDNSHTKISDGKMIISSEKGADFYAGHFIYPKQNFDYSVAIDTRHTSGVKNFAYGFVIGDEEGVDEISFFITNTGNYMVLRGTTPISNWTPDSNILIGDDKVNHLEVYKSDADFKFYINNEHVYTLLAPKIYQKLMVSLVASQDQTIEFDNIQIRGTYQQPMYVD